MNDVDKSDRDYGRSISAGLLDSLESASRYADLVTLDCSAAADVWGETVRSREEILRLKCELSSLRSSKGFLIACHLKARPGECLFNDAGLPTMERYAIIPREDLDSLRSSVIEECARVADADATTSKALADRAIETNHHDDFVAHAYEADAVSRVAKSIRALNLKEPT